MYVGEMEEYIVNSPEEMLALGGRLAQGLKSGDVLALIGDLGAGKTHLSKGICAGLGYVDVSSPTFSLVNELRGQEKEVFHFDFYRIKKGEELWNLGWDEYLERNGIILAEWGNLFPEVFPEQTIWVKITTEGEGRKVLIKRPD